MINYIIAFIFLLFAAVQYNDPDPIVWMIIYGLIAVAYLWKDIPKNALYLLTLPILFYCLSYLPSFIRWVNDGLPSITGTMKAENPEIENMREFFGLAIGVLALLFRIKQRAK